MSKSKPYFYRATIVSIYDGDTVRATLDLGFGFDWNKVQLRLFGLNTPEVRGEERERGLISRDALRKKLEGKEIVIETVRDKTGKYGRYLAVIWADDENINEWLIEKGYAERRDY